MIVLIAESKTMAHCTEPALHIPSERTPLFSREANEIMQRVSGMPTAELSRILKISPALAARLKTMAYEFPNSALGAKAISAFTGVVFRALGYASLSADARSLAQDSVRIISSAYGWLRPDDIVKPYRLDFTPRLGDNGETLAAFWRDKVTGALLEMFSREKDGAILNLLPADAARCIDWKQAALKNRTIKVDFLVAGEAGTLRTPDSSRLKTLRGLLLRQILTEGITIPARLTALESDHYLYSPDHSDPTRLTFITA